MIVVDGHGAPSGSSRDARRSLDRLRTDAASRALVASSPSMTSTPSPRTGSASRESRSLAPSAGSEGSRAGRSGATDRRTVELRGRNIGVDRVQSKADFGGATSVSDPGVGRSRYARARSESYGVRVSLHPRSSDSAARVLVCLDCWADELVEVPPRRPVTHDPAFASHAAGWRRCHRVRERE